MTLDKTMTRLRAMTEVNNHGEAYEFAAAQLGFEDLRVQFAAINRERERLGHLPPELCARRFTLYNKLMEAAKRTMIHDDYLRFYMCF